MRRSAASIRPFLLVFGLAIALVPAAQAKPIADSSLYAYASPGSEAEIVVSTTADLSNGDVSSPVALAAQPGADGISLREAILAANNSPGPHAITFSPSLAGQTIQLAEQLPSLSRDYVSIEGLEDAGGDPAVTIDGDDVEWPGTTVNIIASHIAVRHLRFVHIRDNSMLTVAAGQRSDGSPAPQTVSDVVVEDNVFDQTGFTDGGCGVAAVTEELAQDATLRNVVFRGNRFVNLTRISDSAVAVSIATSGNHTTVEDVSVYENEFTGTELPIEVNTFLNSDNTITGTRIVRNTFSNSDDGNSGITMIVQGVPGQPVTSRNTISDTLVEGNLFSQNSGSSLSVYSGIDNAQDNLVSGLRIVNNILDHDQGLRFTGGTVAEGSGGSANNNAIRGVRIQNNTLNSSTFAVVPNFGVATGNTISDFEITNSIVWNTGHPDLSSYVVQYSLFCDFEGANGNICQDPLFVNPSSLDFHLQSGSPAIDAGTSDGGVPQADMECRQRYDAPGTEPNTGSGSFPYYDMGAHEFGAAEGSCFSPDTAPPSTTIDSGPSGATDDTTPTFSFSSDEAGSTYYCRIDGGSDASCSSPFTSSALSDGSHTFRVWAVDEAGNADTTAAIRSFVVDTLPPNTTIVSGPPALTNDPTPTFAFSSSKAGSTFACSLDTAPFAPCASPLTVPTLIEGAHSFQVRAIDSLGHIDASPALRSLTVDTIPPETSITTGPSARISNRSATFTFSSSEPGSSFGCGLDASAFQSCVSPRTITALGNGSHDFYVRATDQAGNTDLGPAQRSFTVDTVSPQTKIVRAPARKTRKHVAVFRFKANERGSRFQCKLDKGRYKPCSTTKTYRKLKHGAHVFRVRAIDTVGNVDRSPALYRWKIRK